MHADGFCNTTGMPAEIMGLLMMFLESLQVRNAASKMTAQRRKDDEGSG